MDNDAEIIKKYVRSLPQVMRDYVSNEAWQKKLSFITQANKMTEDQASFMKSSVLLTLIGLENYSDFQSNLQHNLVGISYNSIANISVEIEKNIFSEIKPFLIEIEKIASQQQSKPDDSLNKDRVLSEIENPTPVKPIMPIKINPAGQNTVLDAQHNLPAGEKKVLISSSAVPSRGPLLNNIQRSAPAAPPNLPGIIKTQTPPATSPATSVAPKKYVVDPYREPAE